MSTGEFAPDADGPGDSTPWLAGSGHPPIGPGTAPPDPRDSGDVQFSTKESTTVSSGGPDISTAAEPGARAPGLKDVRTIEALVRYAHGATSRFTISPSVRDAVADDESLIVDLRETINTLAASDPLLKVPVRLLSAVDRAGGTSKFRRRCLSAVALMLLSHPTLRTVDGLDLALLDPKVGDPSQLLVDVAGATESGEEDLRKRRTLRSNAVTSVGMFFAIQREWTDIELARALASALWAGEYREARHDTRHSTRAALAEGSPVALGTVVHAWRHQLDEARSQAQTAERFRLAAEAEKETAERAQVGAENTVDRLRAELARRDQEIERLATQVAQEQSARQVQSSHAVDDYENLRTRLIRTIDRQLALLEDGLHALRSGSFSVTEEFIERVIESFVKQADALRDQNSGDPGGTP